MGVGGKFRRRQFLDLSTHLQRGPGAASGRLALIMLDRFSALPPLFCHTVAALFPFDQTNGRPICD
jgi:hypothetical protein